MFTTNMGRPFMVMHTNTKALTMVIFTNMDCLQTFTNMDDLPMTILVSMATFTNMAVLIITDRRQNQVRLVIF